MADAARSQRAAALEEKKRRLEELKARRQNRRGAAEDNEQQQVSRASAANLDEYIDGLLSSAAPQAAAAVQPTTDQPREDDGAVEKEEQPQPTTTPAVMQQPTTPTDDNVIAVAAAAPPARKQVETFTTGTQTQEEDFPPGSEQDEEDETPDAEEKEITASDAAAAAAARATAKTEEEVMPKILSPEEMEEEVASAPFSSFLNTASKKVERVLGAPVLADLLVNYVGEADGLEAGATESNKASDVVTKFLSARQVYECPKWTSTRDVTDMDWSPLHRELMLSSYHMASSATSLSLSAALRAVSPDDTPSASLAPRSGELQSDGLSLVWSLAMPSRPEHIFTCGSPVLAARFHPTESPLVLGGCLSGQLVIWDVRAGRLPVQRSNKGHVHPICSMEITEGGSGLVTAATDGKVNFWSLANLRDPVEALQVDGHLSCLSVAPESHSLVGGDEHGVLHVIQSQAAGAPRASKRPMRKLGAAGLDTNKKDRDDNGSTASSTTMTTKGDMGHYGMITAVATKPQVAKASASSRAGLAKGFLRGTGGLILTSGVDWTVKLWAPAYTDKPLLNFVSHSYDYMCDVQWNPSHPSLFATASSNGSIGLWNLASSLEEPISGSEGIVVEPEEGRGLNKLKWSSDGRRMLVASADRIHVLSLSDDEVLRQKGDEEARVMKNLTSRGLLERE